MIQPELFDMEPISRPQISLEDIFEAYYECRKHKRNRSGAMQFEVDLEKNLIDLWQEINAGTWEPRPSTVFIVKKPVTREIFAAAFRDRIIHHLVIGRLNALFEKQFIFDSYSCRVGKGTHFGIARTEHFIRRCSQNNTRSAWILKIDLRGYFMSINRTILYQKLIVFIDRFYHVFDKDIIKELCKIIIFNDPTKNCIYHSSPDDWNGLPQDKSLFFSKKDCGLPIGNLTSQVFANFYLTDFDHFIKNQLGIKYYGRYVDDCVIVHQSHIFLKRLIPTLQNYLKENLELQIHPRKIYLQPCFHGVKFLGCYIKTTHTVIHHRTLTNFKRSLYLYNTLAEDHKPDKKECDAFISSVNSYLGIMKHYKTFKERCAIMNRNLSDRWYKKIDFGVGLNKIILKGKRQKNQYIEELSNA